MEELDFAEEELFVDEDETLLLDLPPLPSLVPSLLLRTSLDEVSFSGSTKLLLSSSPQATNRNVNANAKTRMMDPRPLTKDDVGNRFFILCSMEISRPKFNLLLQTKAVVDRLKTTTCRVREAFSRTCRHEPFPRQHELLPYRHEPFLFQQGLSCRLFLLAMSCSVSSCYCPTGTI